MLVRVYVLSILKASQNFSNRYCELTLTPSRHSGKSAAIPESNYDPDVCKEHYAWYYVPKSYILLARTGIWKISSVTCGFSSIKIDYSDYPKSLFSRINGIYAFSIKYSDI